MNAKQRLNSRIRGWFPQEPYFQGNHAKVIYENKPQPQKFIEPLYNGSAIRSTRPLIIALVIFDLIMGYFTIIVARDFGERGFTLPMIIWTVSGIIVGAASGVMQTRRIVRKLSKDFQYHPSLRDLVYSLPVLILSLPASGAIALYYNSLLIPAVLQFAVSGAALNTTGMVARFVLFSAYEKRENMSIMQAISGGGLVVIPQPPSSFSGSNDEVKNWTFRKTGGNTLQ